MLRIAQEALTFDDVLLLPGYSEVTAKDVSLVTKLTRNINLNLPLVSAAMDTVTEAGLAIALAQEGGIGIVHKNLTVLEQAEQVRRVKKIESGVVKDPITIDHTATIAELIELTRANGISGVPVMKDGDLAGIVTRRDLRFETDTSQSISAIMTPRNQLVTVKEGASSDEVQRLLHQHRIEKILVVDDAGALKGLITVKDFDKAESFPDACKDQYGQLRVGASIGTSADTDERVDALVTAGVDVLVVDTAHGHSMNVLSRVRWVKDNYPTVDVIGGNIATGDAALALADAGADSVKVGIGRGACPPQGGSRRRPERSNCFRGGLISRTVAWVRLALWRKSKARPIVIFRTPVRALRSWCPRVSRDVFHTKGLFQRLSIS